MNLNKNIILIYILLILFVFFSEYEFIDSKKSRLPFNTLQHLDDKTFDLYLKKHKESNNTGVYWGYQSIKEDVVAEDNKTKIITEVEKKDGSNVICIDKSCYRLIGIYQENGSYITSLYNKDKKEKLKKYLVGDILKSGIKISNINKNSVEFKDLNSTREWNFKIFDVNKTKYKPKEIKDEDI